jgi:hypothetical protein
MNQNLNKISDLQITISSLFLAQNSNTPDTGGDFEINIKQEEEFPPPDQQKDQDFSNQSKSELFNAITNTFPSYTVSDLPHYIDVCLPTVPETAIKIYQNYDLPFLLLPTSAQFEGMSQFLFSTLIDVKLVIVIDTSPLGTFIIHQLQMLKIPQQVQFVLVSDITQCVSTLVQLATRFTSLYAKKSQLRFAQVCFLVMIYFLPLFLSLFFFSTFKSHPLHFPSHSFIMYSLKMISSPKTSTQPSYKTINCPKILLTPLRTVFPHYYH